MPTPASADWRVQQIELHFQDPDTNSNKWYRISVIANGTLGDYRVLYQWGRIGATGSANFKMQRSPELAEYYGQQRAQQKQNKGYFVYQDWYDVPDGPRLRDALRLAGVNTNANEVMVKSADNADGDGVSFEEMGTLVENLLSKAVGSDNDTGDVIVDAATMNAKMARLREQYNDLDSTVEFVNNAVRARL